MAIKLIALDLDGTLLNSAKKISEQTRSVIQQALCEGVQVMLSTARPPRTTLPHYQELGLNSPMANYNGGYLWSPVNEDVWLHHPVSCMDARLIATWACDHYPGIRVSGEIKDRWYTDFYNDSANPHTAILWRPDMMAPLDKWLTCAVTKLLLLGDPHWLDEVEDFIASNSINDRVLALRTEESLLQMISRQASKLAALRLVARRLGIHREEVMAIGDNLNDIGMIEWAGLGVAMANSTEECIAVADHVTDDNNSDGVANAIQSLVIAGKSPSMS